MKRTPDRSEQYSPNFTLDDVEGLSLGGISEQYGTEGLLARLDATFERVGFDDNELVQRCVQLGFRLHAHDKRTNGQYNDHLMRVMLRLIEEFDLADPNLVAAAALHDAIEDHPRELVKILTGEDVDDIATARIKAYDAVADFAGEEIARIVWGATTPIRQAGENKNNAYIEHSENVAAATPEVRAVKLSDFIDNACGNHATIGPKQKKLDEKYLPVYLIHMQSLYAPDSLIVGEAREKAAEHLLTGYQRAKQRLDQHTARLHIVE
jgi:(p)ppGpp synthase/HD superfamily hydrolase